jgi:hypothetical protein
MRLSITCLILMMVSTGCVNYAEMADNLNNKVVDPLREQIKKEMIEGLMKKFEEFKPQIEERLQAEKDEMRSVTSAEFDLIESKVRDILKEENKKIMDGINKAFNEKAAEITAALLAARK